MANILPPNFPALASDMSHYKVQWYYHRYVETYYRDYQFGHFIFAAYAAVPRYLTPDLLYKLWQNFNAYRWGGASISIHRIAVADLLLSSLCHEVGFELYEMHHEIRSGFLEWLQKTTQEESWKARNLRTPQTIALFLMEYHNKLNPGALRWGQEYSNQQDWAIMLATGQQEQLQQIFWNRLNEAIEKKQSQTETLYLLNQWMKSGQLLEALNTGDKNSIIGFLQNAKLAEAWKNLIQQNPDDFIRLFEQDERMRELLHEQPTASTDIMIELPKAVDEKIKKNKAANLFAVLIGIDQYANIQPFTLHGCANDASAVDAYLKSIKNDFGWYDPHILINEQASRASVINAFQHFKRAQSGDVCLFYFAGYGSSVRTDLFDVPEGELTTLVCHDSRSEGVFDLDSTEFNTLLYEVLEGKPDLNFTVILDCSFYTNTTREEQFPHRSLPMFPSRRQIEHYYGFDKDLYRYNPDTEQYTPPSIQKPYILLSACRSYEKAYETVNSNSKTVGLFTDTLLEILRENGRNITYSDLIHRTKLRISSQRQLSQVPNLVSNGPSNLEGLLFLSEKQLSQTIYQIAYYADKTKQEWRLLAGARQGIRPSINFMFTYLTVNGLNGQKAIVKDVFEEYSTLLDFDEKDIDKIFTATLAQNALPKVKIAFDEKLAPDMRKAFEAAVARHDIYYIDLIEKIHEARYLICNREHEYYLACNSTDQQGAYLPVAPIFIYVRDPFDFIKQLEYIAQWRGLLEYDQSLTPIQRSQVALSFEVIEGATLNATNLDTVEGKWISKPEVLELSYRQSKQPAFRCQVEAVRGQVYVSALFLSTSFGIQGSNKNQLLRASEPRPAETSDNALFIELTLRDRLYKTIPISIDKVFVEHKIKETYDFLKIFLSDKPIDLTPLLQENITFNEKELTRSAGLESSRAAFDLSGINWTSITVPIKVVNDENGASWEKKQIQQLIAVGNSEKALELLAQHNADALLLQAQFNNGRKNFNMGLIEHSEWQRIQARVNYAALELAGKLPDDDAPKVFVSYNHKDGGWMRAIKRHLEDKGIQVLIDLEGIAIGSSLTDFANNAVKNNTYFLAVISENSLLSSWVNKELKVAMLSQQMGSNRLILVRIDHALFDDNFFFDANRDIDKKIKDLTQKMIQALNENTGTRTLQEELDRQRDLKNNLNDTIRILKDSLVVDLSDNEKFEFNMDKVAQSIQDGNKPSGVPTTKGAGDERLPPKVFLSYSQKNSEVALRIKSWLETAGAQVFIDQEAFPPSVDIGHFIEEGIKDNYFIVSIISRDSLQSGWANKETTMGFIARHISNRRLLPVKIDNAYDDDDFYFESMDLFDQKIKESHANIQKAIARRAEIRPFQDKLARYEDLKNNFGPIVQKLKSVYLVDIAGNHFESGMGKVLKTMQDLKT